jgi:3-deoxy-D-manno-octulosonic-acid transferase
MKWDAARLAPDLAAAARLAEELGIDRRRPLVVAGSTAPGEHELIRDAVPEDVQLLCAPRRPEWFDDAAAALPGCVRRSEGSAGGTASGRFLLDTIGELQIAYSLADVVVVGRSFGELHGSDMMEPVALGKPTIVGPAVSDFQETVDVLREAGGLLQVSASELPAALDRLLRSPSDRERLIENARRAIEAQQGATDRHAELILTLLAEHVERSLIEDGELVEAQATLGPRE